MEKAISMMAGAKLGHEFWVETLETTVYLKNRSPCSSIEGKIPQEMWSGKQIKLDHLKVLGPQAFGLVPKEKRKKLDSKTKEYVFIGYGNGIKGYKLWNPKDENCLL